MGRSRVFNPPLLPRVPGRDLPTLARFSSDLVRSLQQALADVGHRINNTLMQDGSEPCTKPFTLVSYLSANRPAASAWKGAVIFVPDGGAGAVFQGSDGTSWLNLG